MTKEDLRRQLERMDAQGAWLFTRAQFHIMFPDETDGSLQVSLNRHVRAGRLKRVCRGLYANESAKSYAMAHRRELLVSYLRPLDLNYITGVTVLDDAGVITQMAPGTITVMTTGRSGVVVTDYGTLDFVHTQRSPKKIKEETFWDDERGILIAKKQRAVSDFKRIGKNTDLAEEQAEDLEEYLADD